MIGDVLGQNDNIVATGRLDVGNVGGTKTTPYGL